MIGTVTQTDKLDREIKIRRLNEELTRTKNNIFAKREKCKKELEELTESKKKIVAELKAFSKK